ncbi:MAG: PD-(D/E)XK nuclease family protein [Nostoc sp.]|uniref:PD-(D/E)XK nuclease family protein n=1 Tax=Nostoc sp. TaxID=1180 RepID=UPI002FF52290
MSLFTNLLNLHSGTKPREDFFTEIVAYFLSLNNHILIDWLKHHSIISDENYSSIKISTQQEHKRLETHTEDSKLDIVVELSNGLNTDVIFIESTIGSTEGWRQLEKYAEILSNLPNVRHRILIYITRDYDPKEEIKTPAFNLEPKINFYQLRWYQFYARLQQHATDILAQEILILFFQESIKELKTVQEQYFDFPWKGVSIETVTETDKEQDLDTSPSSIAEV